MKVVLLPGLDGTGKLFTPFIKQCPKDIDIHIISYPNDKKLNYNQLVDFVFDQLSAVEPFVIIAESFSGPIAYKIACKKPEHLKKVIYVASFIKNPNPFFLSILNYLPLSLLLSVPISKFLADYFLFGIKTDAETFEQFRKIISTVPKRILADRLRQVQKLSLDTTSLSKESIYIQPDNDKLVSRYCAHDICADRILSVKGGHFILQANPKECAKVIFEEILQ